MSTTYQPRRRARPRLALTAVAVLAAWASSSAAQALSTSSVGNGCVTSPEYALSPVAGGFEEEEVRRLRVRQQDAEESTTSARQRGSSSTSEASAMQEASSTAASVDSTASTVLSIGAGMGTSAVSSGDLVVAYSSTDSGVVAPTSTSSTAAATSTAVPADYRLPEAFDTTIGTNFTSTACPSFFATFLADPTFTACAPFSLLLTTSTAFFTAERSPYGLLPHVLDVSCSADSSICAPLMDGLAKQIKDSNACGPDIEKGNPLAIEAFNGFLNYRMYQEVGCQRSNSTDAPYCFAEAAARTEPDDLYLYYAGEGTSLPSGTRPDCGSCTAGLFSIYSRYATNSSLLISKTYSGARSAVGVACGPSFAPAISQTTTSSASSTHFELTHTLFFFPALVSAVFALAVAYA
ncbi:hypothetical protein JCM11251_007296 [Rhodosporidiobolus azoricus]